jgi:hypothetical protein
VPEASVFKKMVSSGVTETCRATGCIDTSNDAPSSGKDRANAITRRLVSDEMGEAVSRLRVTAKA